MREEWQVTSPAYDCIRFNSVLSSFTECKSFQALPSCGSAGHCVAGHVALD